MGDLAWHFEGVVRDPEFLCLVLVLSIGHAELNAIPDLLRRGKEQNICVAHDDAKLTMGGGIVILSLLLPWNYAPNSPVSCTTVPPTTVNTDLSFFSSSSGTVK